MNDSKNPVSKTQTEEQVPPTESPGRGVMVRYDAEDRALAYRALSMEPSAVQELVEANFGGGAIPANSLSRITAPGRCNQMGVGGRTHRYILGSYSRPRGRTGTLSIEPPDLHQRSRNPRRRMSNVSEGKIGVSEVSVLPPGPRRKATAGAVEDLAHVAAGGR